MAPSGRILLFVVFILVIRLTEPKDGYRGLSRGVRRSSTRRTTYRTSSVTYYGYGTPGGGYGRGGLTWWQICLIIGGVILGLFFVYCCTQACKQREPESDTPGINTTQDQIQLRDHKIINHSPTVNYQQLPCSDGSEIPPPPQVHNQPTPLPYPPQPAPLPYPPQSAPYPPQSTPYPPPSAPYPPAPYGQPLPVPMVAATAPPPTYDDALDISKEPFGEGAGDRWEDEAEMNRKDFGVI